MHKKLLYPVTCILLAALMLPVVLPAQVITTACKNNHINYDRLGNIDTLINGYIKRNWIKGAITIIVKDNQLIQNKGYGFTDEAMKKPVLADELFRIASQTKAVTAVAIMILYERGMLRLDEPVADFIPEYKNQLVLDKFNTADSTYTTVPAKRAITIRDLLTHTSGLDYPGIGSNDMKAIYAKNGITAGFNLTTKGLSLADAMKKVARLPLIHQPGDKWTYGLNFDLLGYIVEVISGESLEAFFTKNIFQPLGMKDTYFNVPPAKAGRLAPVYTEDSLHHVMPWDKDVLGIDADYPTVKKTYFSGGADLTSTAYDYAIFLQMLLNSGTYNGRQVLAPRTVEMMTSNQIDLKFDGTNEYGLGFVIASERGAAHGPRSRGSFGWGGFWGSTYWVDPKEHLVCLFITQQVPNSHNEVEAKFENMVYSSIK